MAYYVIFEFPSLGAAQSLYAEAGGRERKYRGRGGGPGAVTETRRTARVAARNILAASGSMRVAPTGR